MYLVIEISQTMTNTLCFHLYVESKKENKCMRMTKQKQTHRYKEQTSGKWRWKQGGGR